MNPQFTINRVRLWFGIGLALIPSQSVAESVKYGLDNLLSGTGVAAQIKPGKSPHVSEKDLNTPSRQVKQPVPQMASAAPVPQTIDWHAVRERSFRDLSIQKEKDKVVTQSPVAQTPAPRNLRAMTARERLLFFAAEPPTTPAAAQMAERTAPSVTDLGKFRAEGLSREPVAVLPSAEQEYPRHNSAPVRSGHYQGYASSSTQSD